MKKRVLLIIPALLGLMSCNNGSQEIPLEIDKTNDNYRTYYQIFPYAFADSNGDGVGDIRGIIDKLDYIDNLCFDGLWLTPVHRSETYHKYDVDDYKSIDPKFGTLADYDELVSKCHEKGMTILLDLVFNHSSDDHIWFQKCLAAHFGGKKDDPYYNYYNVVKLGNDDSIPVGYSRYQNSNYAYESRFYSGMPDLNLQDVLDNPNGNLANDLKSVVEFWIKDHNVDGFRLDAVTSYFTGDASKTTEFLTILNKWVKDLKPNAYIVGEGAWGNTGENKRYQDSGVDSFFNFEDAQTGGKISSAIIKGRANYLYNTCSENLDTATEKGMPAPFIANHDTGRMYGACYGGMSVDNLKFGYSFLQMLNGSTFTYYGDEVGMTVKIGTGNNAKDEDKRQPMPWNDKYECKPVSGSTKAKDEEKYPLGNVDSQLKNGSSLVNYVAKVNRLRRAFPAIARGTPKQVYLNDYKDLAVVEKTYKDEKIFIVMNASRTATRKYDCSSLGEVDLKGKLSPSGSVKLNGKNLELSPQSIAILKLKGEN